MTFSKHYQQLQYTNWLLDLATFLEQGKKRINGQFVTKERNIKVFKTMDPSRVLSK